MLYLAILYILIFKLYSKVMLLAEINQNRKTSAEKSYLPALSNVVREGRKKSLEN